MSVTVLIADNDADVQSLLAEVARRVGCVVRTADDGVAARADLERRSVDILVCDLDMPHMTGGQLLAWLEQRPSPPATLIVSGFVDDSVRARHGGRSWIRKVLKKPFDVVEFAGLIRDLVREFARPGPVQDGAVEGA